LPLRGEFDILSARKVARIVDQRAIPIIHSHTSHAHTLAFLAKFLSHKRPKVLVTRRVDFDIYKKGTFKPFTFLKYRYMADHFIAISERIRDVLLQGGVPEEKISLVYSGVDPQRVKGGDGSSLKQRYKVEKGETVLGNISYFADHKAHEDAIAALKIVRERGHKARLFLAGHTGPFGLLRPLCGQQQTGGSFHLHHRCLLRRLPRGGHRHRRDPRAREGRPHRAPETQGRPLLSGRGDHIRHRKPHGHEGDGRKGSLLGRGTLHSQKDGRGKPRGLLTPSGTVKGFDKRGRLEIISMVEEVKGSGL